MAKTEDPVADAVDSTTPDVIMAEPDTDPIPPSEEKPTESSISGPEPQIAVVTEQPVGLPITEAEASVTEAEALPPSTVVPVPSEEEDVPMAETETAQLNEPRASIVEEEPKVPISEEEFKVSTNEETKAPVVDPIVVVSTPSEEPKEQVPIEMEETTELTEQIKKTDSDAGDEPKIVDVDVDSMDVDMADVASVVNGNGVAEVVELVETEKVAVVEAVEQAVKATEEVEKAELMKDMAVTANEVQENVEADKIIEPVEAMEEEKKVEVDDSLIVEKKTEVETEIKPVDEVEDVVDEVMKEFVVEPVTTEKTEMEIQESTEETSNTQKAQSEAVEVAVTKPEPVKMDEEMNGVNVPTTADSQTVTPSDVKITNGDSETTVPEVVIPVIIEQSVTDSTTSPTAILSSSSETNELTETTASDSASGKEKVSRVEITIEQVEKLPGQTTQTTTTHIVKEIIIKEQQVSPTKTGETNATKESTQVPIEQLNGQTNGSAVEHISKTNGKELLADDDEESEKNGDDSDKENEVSTTNENGAAANAESEHLAEVVLKKCTTIAPTAAPDSNMPTETVPDVTA